MTKIIEIEGIGEKYAAALEGAGIATVEAMLDTAGSASDRQALAEKTVSVRSIPTCSKQPASTQ